MVEESYEVKRSTESPFRDDEVDSSLPKLIIRNQFCNCKPSLTRHFRVV